ncbi:hypothetical protein PENTCL1PPCAC_20051, partial [Pristionchus entomophagus]
VSTQPVAVSPPYQPSFIPVILPTESLTNEGSSTFSANGTVGTEETRVEIEVKEEEMGIKVIEEETGMIDEPTEENTLIFF